MSKSNDKTIITQYAAAKIAGVTRQALNNMYKKGNSTFAFFTDDGQVDSSHPHWESYLVERRGKSGNNNLQNAAQKKHGESVSKKKLRERDETEGKEKDRQKFSFYGGVNPGSEVFIPQNISDIKRLAEIQKIAMEMKVKSGELIERRIIADAMDAMSIVVQSYFVDLPRRYSERICLMCDSVGMEKQIEELLSEPIQHGIKQFKKAAEKAVKIMVEE